MLPPRPYTCIHFKFKCVHIITKRAKFNMSSTNNIVATTGIDPPPNVPAPDPIVGTSTAYVRMVHEADLPDDSFQDNYALDDDKEEEEFSLCQKMVHYIGGNMVTSDHWAAVKAVLVFNAGCIVNKYAPMTKENIQIECLAAYKKSIADLDPAYFSEAARHFFMAAHWNKRSTNYWRGSLSQFSGLS